MDGRYRVLQPKTRQGTNELDQPVGWSGIDPQAQAAAGSMDPVRTFETPIVNFPADIVIGNNVTMNIPLPPRCVQIAFISVIPNLAASFNGGGARTIKDGFVMNGLFNSLQVATDAAGSCIIQLGCY